jgi:2-polyprenyl-3-methyl-5-hydroxy-6-metoxy-1,4-benzoquinol methylase
VSASYERTKRIRAKYARYFDKANPIVEVGFGDGMLMTWMQEQGYAVIGVDRNAQWVERASRRDLRVVERDAVQFLLEHEAKFGGVVLSHVIEHIPVERNEALIHFPLDLVRWGLGFVCFGWAGRFSEIFAVGRKGRR